MNLNRCLTRVQLPDLILPIKQNPTESQPRKDSDKYGSSLGTEKGQGAILDGRNTDKCFIAIQVCRF